MTGSALDELLAEARRENSYFDDPGDLEGTDEEGWARIEKDPTVAWVVGVDPEKLEAHYEAGGE